MAHHKRNEFHNLRKLAEEAEVEDNRCIAEQGSVSVEMAFRPDDHVCPICEVCIHDVEKWVLPLQTWRQEEKNSVRNMLKVIAEDDPQGMVRRIKKHRNVRETVCTLDFLAHCRACNTLMTHHSRKRELRDLGREEPYTLSPNEARWYYNIRERRQIRRSSHLNYVTNFMYSMQLEPWDRDDWTSVMPKEYGDWVVQSEAQYEKNFGNF